MTHAIHTGSCHCGALQFEVRTALEPAARCNCSLCRRKGAVMSPPFAADALRIVRGREHLTMYQFNTRVALHYFCNVCGIYPFHQTRKDPNAWRVNLGCLDGVDPYVMQCSVNDGENLLRSWPFSPAASASKSPSRSTAC
jgi:hypothetical protein